VEVRKLWSDIDNAEYLREKLNIPGCQIILRVDRDVFNSSSELVSHDTRYFISSLDPSNVKDSDLQKLVRDHWQIENSLHFVKDRWWDEDRHYLSRPGLGTLFATLTNFALSVLRIIKNPGDSLIETAENLRYSPRKILHIIGFNKT
jgi:predicted transposase YbfD/YdcC